MLLLAAYCAAADTPNFSGIWKMDPARSDFGPQAAPQSAEYVVRHVGATVAFNFLQPDGRIVDERYVDRLAHRHRISLRTGCFCNPGAGEIAFSIARETLLGGEFGPGMSLDDYVEAIGLPSGGAVRASLGLASNHADLERFAAFAQEFVDLDRVPDDLPPRTGC